MKKTALIILILLFVSVIWVKNSLVIKPPFNSDSRLFNDSKVTVSDNFYKYHNNWLKKSETGLWELYVEGDPFARGIAIGKLTDKLNEIQEDVFVEQIKILVPSNIYLTVLKYFVLWFNRNIDKFVIDEYKKEIYGISIASKYDKYSYIAPRYTRILNYHAAHDIGHVMQDKNMVACTSFAVWGGKSKNGTLLAGRNFDFYGGEHFADNKVVSFYNPDKGYKFASISWAGMIGVVSGMNEKGLAVTINASKGKMPKSVGTPVSLLVREILQNAKNIKETIEIAKKRHTFVSESLLVISSTDNKAIVIEKSPEVMSIRNPEDNYIISTNHYLSEAFKNDNINKENIKNSSSNYRYQRVKELLDIYKVIDIEKCARILRDQKGLGGTDIGMGNEKAINQLIAHHSVIFDTKNRLMWVSAGPFQIGKYVAYDLDKIFKEYARLDKKIEIYDNNKSLPESEFFLNKSYKKYLLYKKIKKSLIAKNAQNKAEKRISEFMDLNPEYYETYSVIGDYYSNKGNVKKARDFYAISLSKEIPTQKEQMSILNKL